MPDTLPGRAGAVPDGAAVLMHAHAQYRGPLLAAARRLTADHGARVHLYVSSPDQVAFYRRHGGDAFASIAVADALHRGCRETPPPAAAVVAAARANEAAIGTTINELAMGDRHLGRGFALGGHHHPRSRLSEGTCYIQMLNGYNRAIEFWRGEIDAKRPALLLNTHKIPNLLARRRGVPVRILAASRYKNFHYWAHNEFLESPAIAASFAAGEGDYPGDLEKPPEGHLQMRASFVRDAGTPRMIRNFAHMLLQRVYWRVRGYAKGRNYFIRDELRHLVRMWHGTRRMTAKDRPTLPALAGQDFVFYPLHLEPEAALQEMSPEYFFQLETIAAVARDLPAGTLLAVKEHYAAVGSRPIEFIDQILAFKNVVLLNMAEYGLDVVRQAKAVVTITSTAGFEAAALGVPVVTFGRHNLYNLAPHVRLVATAAELRAALAAALDPAFDRERARADGRRLLAAVLAHSFDLEKFRFLSPDAVDGATMDDAYRRLIQSLESVAA